MPAKIYYDADADLSLLAGKTVAILGYGSQGRAQALNLRDSGVNVIIGQRPGGKNFDRAQSDGFEPLPVEQATRRADIVNMLLPDEVHGEVFRRDVREHLSPGNVLMCSHGFSIHFGQIGPTPGVDRLLVAPKGTGLMVRNEFVAGGGVPCLIATDQAESDSTFQLGLAYAKAIGGTRAGVLHTTFAEETETDLFGEQAVLCGGISSLVQAGYETLVEAGYQPEMAYFECLHELKLVVDLIYAGGMSYMYEGISNTAEYGAYTRGPRVVNEQTKTEMRQILEEIRSGQFARQWVLENQAGAPMFQATRRRRREHPLEEVGRSLRELMSWMDERQSK